MSFQSVFNNATSIQINRRPVVAQTFTRSGLSRTVSRGSNLWTFEVTLPDGPRWSDYRDIITEIELKDKFVEETVNFSNPGLSWLFGYQGDQSSFSTTTVTVNKTTKPNSVVIAQNNPPSSGFIFKKGDLIQIQTAAIQRVYTVTNNVPFNATEVFLHRPLMEEINGNYTIKVGSECSFKIKCIQFPQYNIFDRNQISWNGPFVFQEMP